MVTNIWFRSGISLPEIANRLRLSDVVHDSENYWEWVIGNFGESRIDIARTHTKRRHAADVRLFRLDNAPIDIKLKDALIQELRKFVRRTIYCGRWNHLSGNDFELEVVEEYPIA